MNQGKLEVVKQDMARVKVNILGISKLKQTGMGEFNLNIVSTTAGKNPLEEMKKGEELRWQRSRMGRTLFPHKFIKRTFKHRVNSTKQLLNAGRGHQAPRKATHVFEKR